VPTAVATTRSTSGGAVAASRRRGEDRLRERLPHEQQPVADRHHAERTAQNRRWYAVGEPGAEAGAEDAAEDEEKGGLPRDAAGEGHVETEQPDRRRGEQHDAEADGDVGAQAAAEHEVGGRQLAGPDRHPAPRETGAGG